MSATERRKGAVAEREVAAIFRAHGLAAAQRAAGGTVQLSGDVVGIPRLFVSVKRHETLRLPLWLREANKEAPAGAMPVVAFRQSNDLWFVALTLDDFAELLAVARQ